MSKKIITLTEQLLIILAVILVGTGLDWLIHQLSPDFGVPSWYFRNKVIYGVLIGFPALKILACYIRKPAYLAVGVSLIVAALLQIRYYSLGYNLFFVFFFLMIHFAAFLIPALILFKKYSKTLHT